MNPWIIITLVLAAIIYLIDFLVRKTKWKNNTKQEKISLIVHMLTAGPFVFVSVYGILMGITGCSADTTFGRALYDATIMLGGIFFLVTPAASIASFILRKKNKTKASIWANVIASTYIIVISILNTLTEFL